MAAVPLEDETTAQDGKIKNHLRVYSRGSNLCEKLCVIMICDGIGGKDRTTYNRNPHKKAPLYFEFYLNVRNVFQGFHRGVFLFHVQFVMFGG